jgi:carbon monoxide dehydrogenase subunit G
MKLDGDYVFEARVQDVWDALFDPQVLAAVLPGCEKLDLVDGAYLGELKVKVGPIQGKFSGKVDLLDLDEPKSYRMLVDGRGPQGFVKASATIRLAAEGAGTKITYESEAQVGGKIATVGQRLIETSARAIVKQSLEGLNDNIKIRVAAYAAEAAAAPRSAPAPAPAAEVTPSASTPAASAEVPAAASPAAVPEAAAPAAVPEVAAPAAVPEAATPAAAPRPAPVIEYKKADAGKLAATVAKEVTKTLAPTLLAVGAVLAIIIYLLVR